MTAKEYDAYDELLGYVANIAELNLNHYIPRVEESGKWTPEKWDAADEASREKLVELIQKARDICGIDYYHDPIWCDERGKEYDAAKWNAE